MTNIERIARTFVQTEGTTVGDLRAALSDPDIPDYAELIDIQFGCDHQDRDDFGVDDLVRGEPMHSHSAHVAAVIEWEL